MKQKPSIYWSRTWQSFICTSREHVCIGMGATMREAYFNFRAVNKLDLEGDV